MASRTAAVMQQEHAVPVRLSEAADPAVLSHYTLVVDEGAPQPAGGPDAPLRAAVTALHCKGILASISQDGGCVDLLLQRRSPVDVRAQIEHMTPSMRLTGAGESPSAAVLSSCVEQAVSLQLIVQKDFCPVEFHGSKWLVRKADKGPALQRIVGAPAQQHDCVSLKLRATRSDSRWLLHYVLSCRVVVSCDGGDGDVAWREPVFLLLVAGGVGWTAPSCCQRRATRPLENRPVSWTPPS
jgi:hypothetical protein